MTTVVQDSKAKTFPERLRKLRKARGFTQAALAKQIGVDNTTICKYETGDRTPDVTTAFKLAACLKVRIDDLFKVKHMD